VNEQAREKRRTCKKRDNSLTMQKKKDGGVQEWTEVGAVFCKRSGSQQNIGTQKRSIGWGGTKKGEGVGLLPGKTRKKFQAFFFGKGTFQGDAGKLDSCW